MKKYTFLSIAVVITLLLTGSSFAQFNEAPELAARVDAGELPPVEARLPADPFVVVPHDRVGVYGGTWRRAFLGPSDMSSVHRLTHEALVRWNEDASEILPNLVRDWDVTPDGREFTFYLREGLRWSDGHPFTTEDLQFWYEDVFQNKDLTPSFAEWLTTEGEPVELEVIDEVTFKMSFPQPYGLFVTRMATFGNGLLVPKHYAKQFHVNYVAEDELAAMVAEADFEHWYQLYGQRMSEWAVVGRPTLSAWVTETPNSRQNFILSRNPYYWKVDTEGNQLPYIDRIVNDLVQDSEVINLRAVAGEIDMQFRHLTVTNLPVFVDNAATGNYDVRIWRAAIGSDVLLQMSQNHHEPVLGELLRTKEFRQALSVAINREEVNDLVYLGTGVPRQATVIPESTLFEPEFATAWAQYDPDLANQMLDELGLDERNAAGYRLRPDGEVLSLIIEVAGGVFGPWVQVCELVADYWQQVGVRSTVQSLERSYWVERTQGREPQVVVWNMDRALTPLVHPYWWLPQGSYTGAPLWAQWYNSRGAAGEEPTEEMKRVMELYDMAKATADVEEQTAYGKEMMRIHSEQVWNIGVVGLNPGAMAIGVVKNYFHNVPEVGLTDVLQISPANTYPEQYFMTTE